jgi:protein O-GlcNAcase/histone acetyltransferase
MTQPDTSFLAGVIEGFYGQPWTGAERLELFGLMAACGLDTYVYAAKDDLKHRACWRDPYAPSEARAIAVTIDACRRRAIRFVYGIGPGLDIQYSRDADLELLTARFEQMLALGCDHFALLFDDIPDVLDAADLARWGSLAMAQCHVANTIFAWTRERRPGARLIFCPTPYCGRMAAGGLGGPDYLATVGRALSPGIDMFWTGPDIVSREITVTHVQDVQAQIRRKPIIWDNLHTNDYDGRRCYCGPYSGRPPELRTAIGGLLSNPNTELPLDYVAIRTLAAFLRCDDVWDARQAYLSAVGEWHSRFAVTGPPIDLDDLVRFCDCYYLPYEEGPEAEALYALARGLLARPPAEWGDDAAEFRRRAARLRDVCVRLGELRERPLFNALSRRVWELREELDLLLRYVAALSVPTGRDAPFQSDFHRPGTYRGGLVARLQRLLVQYPDGTFGPAGEPGARPSHDGDHARRALAQ